MTPKTGTSKQNYHRAALTSASQIHKSFNTPTEIFAPEERYVYRTAIEPIPARQRRAMCMIAIELILLQLCDYAQGVHTCTPLSYHEITLPPLARGLRGV